MCVSTYVCTYSVACRCDLFADLLIYYWFRYVSTDLFSLFSLGKGSRAEREREKDRESSGFFRSEQYERGRERENTAPKC